MSGLFLISPICESSRTLANSAQGWYTIPGAGIEFRAAVVVLRRLRCRHVLCSIVLSAMQLSQEAAMVKFNVLVDTVNGPPKYGEAKSWSMIESRDYNRGQFIRARRSLSLMDRLTYDNLVRAILARSPTAWSGHPSIGIADLAELVCEGWVRYKKADRNDGKGQDCVAGLNAESGEGLIPRGT